MIRKDGAVTAWIRGGGCPTALPLSLLMLVLLPAAVMAQEVRFHEFPNGLGLYYIKLGEATKFKLSVTVWVGSVDEDPKKNGGVSHLLEHIVFHQPDVSEKEFKAQIESRGGSYNGGTSRDYTQYHVTLPTQHLELGQRWLHKALVHDRLVTDRLEEEKAIINRENGWSPPTWWDRLWDVLRPDYLKLPGFWEHQFRLPEYDRPAGGTYRVASQLTAAHLDAHYRAYYYPENMVLVYTGPHELEEVLSLVDPTFGRVPPTGRKAILRPLLVNKSPGPWFRHELHGVYQIGIGQVYTGLAFSQRAEVVLYKSVLSQLLEDRFRYGAGKTYSVLASWREYRGAGYVRFDLQAAPDIYWKQLKEVEEFVWGDLGKHLSQKEYDRYKTTLLEQRASSREPEAIHDRIWGAIAGHPLHRPNPEETDFSRQWRSFSYQEFLSWARTWRDHTAPSLELSMPAAPFPYVHLLAFAFSIGLGAHLGRSFLRRPFPRENVKLISRVSYGIPGWTQLGLFYLAATSVYYHVGWATGYGTLVLARPYAHAALLEPYLDPILDGLLIALCIVLAGLIMPRKVLVTDGALVLKMRSPLFSRIPLSDIQSVERVSAWSALGEIVRLRALPVYPWFWRGVLIKRKSGRALVLHTKDDRELLELLSPREPWEQTEPEMSTLWASQVAGDAEQTVAVLGDDPEKGAFSPVEIPGKGQRV